MNASGKQGRAVKARLQNSMYLLVGMKQIAIHLRTVTLNSRRNIQERKALRILIAFLRNQGGKVQRTDVDSGRGAGFHPGGGDTQRSQLVGNPIRRHLPDAASLKSVLADIHPTVEEGAGS